MEQIILPEHGHPDYNKIYAKLWRLNNPNYNKDYHSKKKIEHNDKIFECRWKGRGIKDFDYERYLVLLKKQKGKCKICKCVLNPPYVDHNHNTGKVRGLLCRGCNVALGTFQDSIKILKNAVKYLENSK